MRDWTETKTTKYLDFCGLWSAPCATWCLVLTNGPGSTWLPRALEMPLVRIKIRFEFFLKKNLSTKTCMQKSLIDIDSFLFVFYSGHTLKSYHLESIRLNILLKLILPGLGGFFFSFSALNAAARTLLILYAVLISQLPTVLAWREGGLWPVEPPTVKPTG